MRIYKEPICIYMPETKEILALSEPSNLTLSFFKDMAPYLTEKLDQWSSDIGAFGRDTDSLLNGVEKVSDMASQELISSSCFLRLRSRKAGLIGVETISILNVNNATISDMAGLKSA